jgi:asparagine synthase (glutamine-hydrolysing)
MKIKNRGPDKSTFITNSNYIIGFHRLAIMDTSICGDQPFSYSYYFEKDGHKFLKTIYLMCNGEIYNFKELKENSELIEYLEKINYKYKSLSDCEVLLTMYLMTNDKENFMNNFLQQINGEFAFAIYDIETNISTKESVYKLYMARDRFGIRPLFYSKLDDNTIVYGSEMKSIVGINDNKVEVFDPRSTQLWFNKRENNINKLETISKFILIPFTLLLNP